MNFLWLIFAHYIGDFALQSNWQAECKGRLWYVMLSHCMVWAGTICIALQFLGILAIWKVIFLVGGHWAIDKWKSNQIGYNYIYPDQVLHLGQLIVVYYV